MRRRERAALSAEEREGASARNTRDPRRTPWEPSQGMMQAARRHPFLTAARRFCSSFLCCRWMTACQRLSSTDHRSASAIQEELEKTREETNNEPTMMEKTDEEPKREETVEEHKREETDEDPKREETVEEAKEETDKEPKREETDEDPKEKKNEEPKEETAEELKTEDTDKDPKTEETEEDPKTEEKDEGPKTEETDEELKTKETDEAPKTEETDEETKMEKTDEDPETEETDEDPETEETVEEPILQPEERTAFFRCLEKDHVKMFLARDSCYKISDKYLLAMVLMYLRRAGLRTKEYSIFFYPTLFLANQMEEDETFRREIFPWALGPFWMLTKDWFLHLRNRLLERMEFKVWVDRATCDLIMAQDPEHWAWTRERKEHHSWAIRWYRRDPDDYILKGPWRIPPPCSLCTIDVHPCAGEENTECQTDTKEEPGAAESHTSPLCRCQDGDNVCWVTSL